MKKDISANLLKWYDAHRRVLPWRALPGETTDPYRVWLSEIMLQQTTVATVGPYFRKFLARWPTLADLARAPMDDVLAAWAGLGYYSRARNLYACAQAVMRDHSGIFPDNAAGLMTLPGIGPYTAAAIAAIAYGEPATVVDGNVERVVARLFALTTPMPTAKPELRRLAATLTPQKRAGDFAQAMMDLGATVCTPRNPKCDICPIAAACDARAQGIQAELPRRVAKQPRPERRGIAFWLQDDKGRVLLRRRPPEGLLGGMVEIPSSAWLERDAALAALAGEAPLQADWQATGRGIRHVFTHFALELEIAAANINKADLPLPYFWATVEEMETLALPSIMRKVVAVATKINGKGASR